MEMFSYLWLDLMMKSVVHWSTLIYMTALSVLSVCLLLFILSVVKYIQ